jgi:hypothetical protein
MCVRAPAALTPCRIGERPEAFCARRVRAPEELRERAATVVFKRFFSAFDAEGLEAEPRAQGVDASSWPVSTAMPRQASALMHARGFEVAIGEDLVGSATRPAAGIDWLHGRAFGVLERGDPWHGGRSRSTAPAIPASCCL